MAKYKVKDGKSITIGRTVKGPGFKFPEDAPVETIKRLLRLECIEIDNSEAEAIEEAKTDTQAREAAKLIAEANVAAGGNTESYADKTAKELKKIASEKGIEYDKNASKDAMLELLNTAEGNGDNE